MPEESSRLLYFFELKK